MGIGIGIGGGLFPIPIPIPMILLPSSENPSTLPSKRVAPALRAGRPPGRGNGNG